MIDGYIKVEMMRSSSIAALMWLVVCARRYHLSQMGNCFNFGLPISWLSIRFSFQSYLSRTLCYSREILIIRIREILNDSIFGKICWCFVNFSRVCDTTVWHFKTIDWGMSRRGEHFVIGNGRIQFTQQSRSILDFHR